MLSLPDYKITDQVYESLTTLVYRGTGNKDYLPAVLKMIKEDCNNRV